MDKDREKIIQTLIKGYDEIIAHYDFVINDISSEIADPELESTKAPTVEFLKKLRSQWNEARENLLRQYFEVTSSINHD